MSSKIFSFAVIFVALSMGVPTYASELDNEASITNEQIQLSENLPNTVVIRVRQATQEVEVLHSTEDLDASEALHDVIAQREFKKIDVNDTVPNELDQDSSRSSWYFYFYNTSWYYPTYYYYGYNYAYTPYYSYVYGGYAYSYYRWGYRYWY